MIMVPSFVTSGAPKLASPNSFIPHECGQIATAAERFQTGKLGRRYREALSAAPQPLSYKDKNRSRQYFYPAWNRQIVVAGHQPTQTNGFAKAWLTQGLSDMQDVMRKA